MRFRTGLVLLVPQLAAACGGEAFDSRTDMTVADPAAVAEEVEMVGTSSAGEASVPGTSGQTSGTTTTGGAAMGLGEASSETPNDLTVDGGPMVADQAPVADATTHDTAPGGSAESSVASTAGVPSGGAEATAEDIAGDAPSVPAEDESAASAPTDEVNAEAPDDASVEAPADVMGAPVTPENTGDTSPAIDPEAAVDVEPAPEPQVDPEPAPKPDPMTTSDPAPDASDFVECEAEQRGLVICTTEYAPVCGVRVQSVQCFAPPCEQVIDFGNSCAACATSEISGYWSGTCEVNGLSESQVAELSR